MAKSWEVPIFHRENPPNVPPRCPVLGPVVPSPGGDLAAPEQRGIVSAAMGVATSVGVAAGEDRGSSLGILWGYHGLS